MLGVTPLDPRNELYATDTPVLQNVENQVAFNRMLKNDVERKLPLSARQVLTMRTYEIRVCRALRPRATTASESIRKPGLVRYLLSR